MAVSALLCENGEPPAYTADMAAFPGRPAALRADMHRRTARTDPRRKGIEEPAIGQCQPGVAARAASQRIEGPDYRKASHEFLGARVDVVSFENNRPVGSIADLDETPIAS